MMEVGIDNRVTAVVDPSTGAELTAVQRMSDLLEEIELAGSGWGWTSPGVA